MKNKLLAMMLTAVSVMMSASITTAAEFLDECDYLDYQYEMEEEGDKDLTMEDFWSFYDNGTYKVGCTSVTVCVMDQNDQVLAKFRDIPFASYGAFQPGTNIFVVKSTTGLLGIYDLDQLKLVKVVSGTETIAQDEGFGFTSDGDYFYNIEYLDSSVSTQLVIYDTEDFEVEKILFTEEKDLFLEELEFFEDDCYVFGFVRGEDDNDYFVGELINDSITNINFLSWDDQNELRSYKGWEKSGFTDAYRVFWFGEDELFFSMKTIREYVEEEKELILHVEPVIQRLLDQVEHYEFVTDAEGSDYAARVMFTVSEPITNVKYSSFQPDYTEDYEMVLNDKKELLSMDSFTPEQLLVAELEFMEFMPNHCLEFTDQNGTEHCYLLSESGRDGMPVLSEYEF